jgi:hypothetical protein
MNMMAIKKGDIVEFHHHDGDYKWYRRTASVHSSCTHYVLVHDEKSPDGILQVESALLIEPEKKRVRKKTHKESEELL